MLGLLQFLCARDKLLADSPNVAEAGVALDIVDSSNDLADGINSICNYVSVVAHTFTRVMKNEVILNQNC